MPTDLPELRGQLTQISLTFSREEDRLLLTLATSADQEVQFWLTRRITAILWQAVDQLFDRDPRLVASTPDPGSREHLLAWERQHSVESADFSKEYQERGARLTGNPLLVHTLRYGHDSDPETSTPLLTLGLYDAEDSGVTLRLERPQMHALMHLIDSKQREAEWDLQTDSSTPVDNPPPQRHH